MSERLLDKLYIGIDLKEESAMLSYFHQVWNVLQRSVL